MAIKGHTKIYKFIKLNSTQQCTYVWRPQHSYSAGKWMVIGVSSFTKELFSSYSTTQYQKQEINTYSWIRQGSTLTCLASGLSCNVSEQNYTLINGHLLQYMGIWKEKKYYDCWQERSVNYLHWLMLLWLTDICNSNLVYCYSNIYILCICPWEPAMYNSLLWMI